MENTDILKKSHIHFVGICGISMSGLAVLIQKFGIRVTGSDMKYDSIIDTLRKLDIDVYTSHDANNISDDCDLVVYTGAIANDNIELITAKVKGICIMERSEFLGEVCKLYTHVIAIAGTHGKTTTTGMLSLIFKYAGLNPTIHIGGICNNFESNVVIGGRDYFITEACEYKNSFRYIDSETAVITSTDPDHLDTYNSVTDLKRAYQSFAKKSTNLVITENVKDINKKGNVVRVGYNDKLNIVAKNIKRDVSGRYSFDAWHDGKYLTNFKLNTFGRYNIENALCAIAVALEYGISIATIYDALIDFKGVMRRNEKIASIGSVPIICDYAHHPTEICSTISAYKSVYKRILCVFQPHTYTRTKNFMPAFKTCFKGVSELIVYKTYPAREKKIDGADAIDLYNNVKLAVEKKEYVSNKFALKKAVLEKIKNVDCVLVLGAGNIYNIAKNVFKSQ